MPSAVPCTIGRPLWPDCVTTPIRPPRHPGGSGMRSSRLLFVLGPSTRTPARRRRGGELALERRALGTDLGEARAEHDGEAHAARAALEQDLRTRCGRRGDHGEVERPGYVAHARVDR